MGGRMKQPPLCPKACYHRPVTREDEEKAMTSFAPHGTDLIASQVEEGIDEDLKTKEVAVCFSGRDSSILDVNNLVDLGCPQAQIRATPKHTSANASPGSLSAPPFHSFDIIYRFLKVLNFQPY